MFSIILKLFKIFEMLVSGEKHVLLDFSALIVSNDINIWQNQSERTNEAACRRPMQNEFIDFELWSNIAIKNYVMSY